MSHLTHTLKFIFGREVPETQTSAKEQEAIFNYAREAGAACEIGVFEGFNTALIAQSIGAESTLWGVDPFFKGRLGISYGKVITTMHLRRKSVMSKVRLVSMLSFDAYDVVPSELDFIFIDGDHSYEGIKKDWDIYSGKVKVGGVIALHDTANSSSLAQSQILGSHRFFDDTIVHDERFNCIERVDSTAFMRRLY